MITILHKTNPAQLWWTPRIPL